MTSMPKNSGDDCDKRRQGLPLGVPKRGCSRVEAAQYVGVGTSKFDELVEDGRMPKPKRIDGRRVWDRHQLDMAFTALPDNNDRDDIWDTVAR